MEYFLDNFQLRKLHLLNLLDSENRYFSITELSARMNIANPTVDKAVEALKSDCHHYGIKLVLERKMTPARSVYVRRKPLESNPVNVLRKCYIRDSLNFCLLEVFFFQKFSGVKEFAKEQFISHSMIYNKTSQINDMLHTFDLTLSLSTPASLIGKETQIRFFYVSLFWSTYDDFDWPLTSERESFSPLLDDIEKLLCIRMTPTQREYYRLWIGVIANRVACDYLMVDEFEKELDPSLGQLPTITSLKKHFEEIINTKDTNIVNQEFLFFLLVIYSFDTRDYFIERFDHLHLSVIHHFLGGELEHQAINFVTKLVAPLNKHLSKQDYDHFYLNLLNIHLRYLFFSGSSKSFHYYKDTPLNPIENFFNHHIIQKIKQSKEELPMYRQLEEDFFFVEETSLFFYYDLLALGYLPSISVLILSPYPDYFLMQSIASQLPMCRFDFSFDLSRGQQFDVVISDNNYKELKNINYQKITYINRYHCQRDIAILKEKLMILYVEKLKSLLAD